MSITTITQLEAWCKELEHQGLEFKEAKNQYSKEKLSAYCVAIANEGGGKFILGVSDTNPRQIVGTNAFGNVTALAEQLFQSVGFRVDVEQISHSKGRVLVFHIPGRPPGTAYHLDGKYLMRSGSSLVAMSADRLREIFAEGQPRWEEGHTLTGLRDTHVIELLDTSSFFALMKQPYPTNKEHVIEKLTLERLIDKVLDGYAIRRLGALLLARNLSDFPELAHKSPRITVYRGNTKLKVSTDLIDTRGYAVGFQRLVEYITEHLPQQEVIERSLRKSITLVPEEAVRELVANALIHQDLTITGMFPTIEIYANRIEITNAGNPIVPVERFIDSFATRNEHLADLMRRLSICEERSSGVDRVITVAENSELPAPYFGAQHNRTHVIVYGPRPFEKMDKEDRIRACYQHCALKRANSEAMSNQSLRERFGLVSGKQAIVSQIIEATIREGLIKLDEASGTSRRYARYLPFWA